MSVNNFFGVTVAIASKAKSVPIRIQ